MNVYFGQLYIEPGASFPFSHSFQLYLAEVVTSLVTPSETFVQKYGADFDLMIRVSAKRRIQDNEIVGPTVFRKTKDVEYTVFLPFDVTSRDSNMSRSALLFLLQGTCSIFELLGIDPSQVLARQASMIETICEDPMMFE